MDGKEINTLAVLIADYVMERCDKDEIRTLVQLLSIVLCALKSYC
ncbi:MAG: hypothetical protein SPG87_06165 [Eubacteriales bacterium]|nr:hypothetical protein [Eubacteriales bacterium]